MSNDKVTRLIRWNSADAEAIAAQLLSRVQKGLAEGRTVGVVTCLIYTEDDGQCYETAFSTLPVEVSLWAAEKIRRDIHKVVENT